MGVDNALDRSRTVRRFPCSTAAPRRLLPRSGARCCSNNRSNARRFVVERAVAFAEGDARLIALPSPDFRVRSASIIEPPDRAHFFSGVVDPATYRDEIAPARTWGYLQDVEALRARWSGARRFAR